MPDATRQITIRGDRIGSLADSCRKIGEAVNGEGGYFGSNLDALADCLRGEFGAQPPFGVVWLDSSASASSLGHAETARYLEQNLARCHPDCVNNARQRLEAARRSEGVTLFEAIVAISETREASPWNCGRSSRLLVHRDTATHSC